MIGQFKWGDVLCDLVKFNDVRREVIFSDDGVDYLYTQHFFDVTATYNPEATSYNNLVGNEPKAGPAFAARTDRVLSDYLSTPRRTLTIWAYDDDGNKVVYFESPPKGSGPIGRLPCDAKNGPICKVFSINGADVHGAKTWLCHLQFISWVNNCLDGTSPVLSHRWTSSIDYDEQYRAIRTTRGLVVFHVGRLFSSAVKQSPDHYRDLFFQPPPPNFIREHVSVEVSSDNTTATYTVVDGEKFFSTGPNSPAVKCEAMLTTWGEQGSVANAMAQSAPSFMPTMLNSFGSLAAGHPVQAIQGVFGHASGVGGNVVAQLPKYYVNIKVRAHGARNSARNDLYKLCLAIAFARLGKPAFFTLANRTQITVTQALDDTFVELDMSLRYMDQTLVALAGAAGPFASLATVAGLTAGGALNGDRLFRFLDSYFNGPATDDPLGNDTAIHRGLVDGPSPLASLLTTAGGIAPDGYLRLLTQQHVGNRPMNTASATAKDSRGVGYVKRLMAQALLGQCETPPLPGIWDKDDTSRGVPTVNVPFMPDA